ncbi:MAG: hypothetical protein IJQ82_11475, partial [Selenomonadaceae bacterium]|nr:hypothetical protein [Selenomonadaceae bacterium]
TFIIVILMSVAIPNAARMIDRVALDYETKRLYSELRFLQELNRTGTIKSTGMVGVFSTSTNASPSLKIAEDGESYQIVRGINNPVREPHYLRYGVKISLKSSDTVKTISFNEFGNIASNTLTLTSRLGKEKYIVLDGVGRIRGSLTNEEN